MCGETMKPTELLHPEQRLKRINLQVIKSLVEKEFEKAIRNRVFTNEKHFSEELTEFLKITLPANVRVVKEVKTKMGVVDILIDGNYILELKYADNKGTLDRGIAEVVRYKKLGKPVIMTILDVGILSPRIITQYRNYYKENGAEAIVMKAVGYRKRVGTVTSFVEN